MQCIYTVYIFKSHLVQLRDSVYIYMHVKGYLHVHICIRVHINIHVYRVNVHVIVSFGMCYHCVLRLMNVSRRINCKLHVSVHVCFA